MGSVWKISSTTIPRPRGSVRGARWYRGLVNYILTHTQDGRPAFKRPWSIGSAPRRDERQAAAERREAAMIKAYVLVVTNPGETRSVVNAVGNIPGVVEMHEVMGPYDIVIEIEVDSLKDVPPILSDKIRSIPGIESTTSLVTFPEGE
jgi:DNA-binding Lrp family transcriptional regulator